MEDGSNLRKLPQLLFLLVVIICRSTDIRVDQRFHFPIIMFLLEAGDLYPKVLV